MNTVSSSTDSDHKTAAPSAGVQPCMVTVVVPVRNEQRCIRRTLDGLLSQDYPTDRIEVLVVDGDSTDRTCEIVSQYAESHPQVRLLHNTARWSSSARNVGVRAAQGAIIVVVDGHCEFRDDQFLAHVVAAFERSGADCVGRPQPLEVSRAGWIQRAIAAARSSWLGHHPDSYIYASGERFVPAHSVATAYRRSVFDRVGLFDETFDACEDVELNHRIDRAGMTCYFCDRTALAYVPRASFARLFRQLLRYGRGRMRLLRKHRDTFSLRTLTPALLVLGLAGGLIGMWFSQWLAFTYLAVVGVYVALLVGGSITAAVARRDLALVPALPLVLLTIHIAAGAGLLIEWLAGPATPPRRQTPVPVSQDSNP